MSLLDEGRLRITATDQDGVSTSTEIPGVRLFEDRERTIRKALDEESAGHLKQLFAAG